MPQIKKKFFKRLFCNGLTIGFINIRPTRYIRILKSAAGYEKLVEIPETNMHRRYLSIIFLSDQ